MSFRSKTYFVAAVLLAAGLSGVFVGKPGLAFFFLPLSALAFLVAGTAMSRPDFQGHSVRSRKPEKQYRFVHFASGSPCLGSDTGAVRREI